MHPLSFIFPWPRRADRHRDIADARKLALESERRAGEADQITSDIHRLRAENHFAQMVETAITGREREVEMPRRAADA